jgi:predicted O-methyltransferase YrrM
MNNKLYFEHLKNFSSTEGYWSTSDCSTVAKDIILKTKASSLLEIGFNIGYSASVWLENGITELYVIDINNHKDTESAILSTRDFYNIPITYLLDDSTSQASKDWNIPKVDMAFIDGGHTYDIALSDSILAVSKGADWLVYDDVIENHQNGIWKAIEELESKNIIELECSYPMTWVGEGYVVLAKVLQ